MPASPTSKIRDFGRVGRHQEEHTQGRYYPLGCIFDNPIAFEDSRRKIDLCNDGGRSEEVTQIGRWKMDVLEDQDQEQGQGLHDQLLVKRRGDLPRKQRPGTCRRKLWLDGTDTPRAREPSKSRDELSSTSSSSSSSSSCPEDLLELKLDRNVDDPMCTPDNSSACVVRSLDSSLEETRGDSSRAGNDRKQEFDWTRNGSCSETSATESAAASRTSKDDEFCVYPGWSLWNGGSKHSYRSINDSPVRNSCAPSLRRLGVKSLHQHLLAAARQHSPGGTGAGVTSAKSPNGKVIVTSRSPRVCSSLKLNRVGSRTKVSNVEPVKAEEAKVPLLKTKHHHARKHSWAEPVTFFSRGLKSLTSKGFPSVIPLNIPRPQQLKAPEDEHLMALPPPPPLPSSSSSMGTVFDGYLQCIYKQGVVSYSFWKDDFDEVMVAKVGDPGITGDRCFTFYSCRRKDRGGWKQWQKPMVSRVGSMNLSSSIRTEADCRGEIVHYMESEFSLLDEQIRKQVSTATSSRSGIFSTYLKTLWTSAQVKGSAGWIAGSEKEIAATIVRVPLKVKKEWRNAEAGGTKPKKPLGRLLRKQSERRSISQASWNSIVGSASETVTVVLPAGDHGHPICGLEGPRPLIERWRSGGHCDCGSWDLGCGIVVLSKEYAISMQGGGGDKQPLCFLIEGRKDKGITMSLRQCQDGLYKLSFQEPLISLQAFAVAVAILHSKSDVSDYRDYWSQEWQTKLPAVKGNLRRSRGRCHPNPPMSPIDRL